MSVFARLKQGAQVGFVYLFLYGLLFAYVTWTMYYGCGPSIFTATFSGIVVCYTSYSTINFWGENNKYILLWIILLILSISSLIFGILSCINSCNHFIIDNGEKQYQWVYQIYFPDIALLPWIFILGFTSMRYFFIKWKLVKLFFVFLSYNAFFIGVGIYIIGYYILENKKEYELIWQLAIIIICIGAFPCCIFIIYSIIINIYYILFVFDDDDEDDDDDDIEMRTTNVENDNIESFNPYQPFTIWIAIQMITSFLDLLSDIIYALSSDFYSPYLKIACWIFIFFQLIPDFFVLLQIMSDPDRYYQYDENENNEDDNDNNHEIIWYPLRRKWSNQSHILERTIFVVLYIIFSTTMFLIIATILILLKIIPITSVQNGLFHHKCFKILQIPPYRTYDDDDDDNNTTIIDLRLHLIFLLFEVFFESIPLVTIILLNSYVLLDNMGGIAWISLAISTYVVLRNIYMFFDDICISNKSQRKLYYCL